MHHLVVPDNAALLPKCPELNPVRNIWPFMRDNWLSNRIYTDLSGITDHYCKTGNRLTDSTSRITSIGMHHWIHPRHRSDQSAGDD